ncbi:hypothetical protein OAN22_02270 [Alphaproteobacteria bacterium]|nr:hypothetical protein [Alphaproteobacteria bacterium]
MIKLILLFALTLLPLSALQAAGTGENASTRIPYGNESATRQAFTEFSDGVPQVFSLSTTAVNPTIEACNDLQRTVVAPLQVLSDAGCVDEKSAEELVEMMNRLSGDTDTPHDADSWAEAYQRLDQMLIDMNRCQTEANFRADEDQLALEEEALTEASPHLGEEDRADAQEALRENRDAQRRAAAAANELRELREPHSSDNEIKHALF